MGGDVAFILLSLMPSYGYWAVLSIGKDLNLGWESAHVFTDSVLRFKALVLNFWSFEFWSYNQVMIRQHTMRNIF